MGGWRGVGGWRRRGEAEHFVRSRVTQSCHMVVRSKLHSKKKTTHCNTVSPPRCSRTRPRGAVDGRCGSAGQDGGRALDGRPPEWWRWLSVGREALTQARRTLLDSPSCLYPRGSPWAPMSRPRSPVFTHRSSREESLEQCPPLGSLESHPINAKSYCSGKLLRAP